MADITKLTVHELIEKLDAKEITSGGINQSNLMSGDFPYLKPSSNTISYTGTITQFKIKYKKAYL